jgi:basic amino acid/polyamine antiporter, APA family
VLTAPRVYFAMAEDRVFFQAVARVNERTRVPVLAIVLQSVWTIVILLSGRYEQILNYVVSMDFLFFAITASCLFVMRRRGMGEADFRMPGYPWTTAAFCIASVLVVINTLIRYPENTLVGVAILISGVPVYFLWRKRRV